MSRASESRAAPDRPGPGMRVGFPASIVILGLILIAAGSAPPGVIRPGTAAVEEIVRRTDFPAGEGRSIAGGETGDHAAGWTYPVRGVYGIGPDAIELRSEGIGVLRAVLEERFGTPVDPFVRREGGEGTPGAVVDRLDPERLRRGERFYFANCHRCHGGGGAGDGGTSLFHPAGQPTPRDFTRGIFKFKSTEARKPHREDLLRTVRGGLPGSTMSSYARHAEEDLQAVVDYVIFLSVRGETEERLARIYIDFEEIASEEAEEIVETILEEWNEAQEAPRRIRIPEPPPFSPEAVERGRALYRSAAVDCARCHGPGGAGDGPEAEGQKDDWGRPVLPRDLTLGIYRAGGAPTDLYRTIHRGIGSGMPNFSNLEPDAIWDLVRYLHALPREDRE